MTSKTWFLPADFTFLPDGQLALGSVIPHPQRPTVTLASLADHPDIVLPPVTSLVETKRDFLDKKSPSFGFKLFGKVAAIAGFSAHTDVSSTTIKAYSEGDHEVRAYNGAFSPAALKAIMTIDGVKEHIDSGRFGKRCTYVISGLRVAHKSFTVTDETTRTMAVSFGGSASVTAGGVPIPVEAGADISKSNDRQKTASYETAPGIVFAYRLHVIRPKGAGLGAGGEAELFSDRTAFFSGEAVDDEDEEMEVVGVNEVVLRQDLDRPPGGFDVQTFEADDDESFVVFESATGK